MKCNAGLNWVKEKYRCVKQNKYWGQGIQEWIK